MLVQANQNVSSGTSPEQNEAGLLSSINPSTADRNGRAQYSGILKFASRMVIDRNWYGALAFAETAESLRLNARALKVGRNDRVVGITTSGDVLLSLLAAGPEAIIGLDANMAQTVLTHLKLVAIQALSVEDYLQFMGVKHTAPETRMAVFNRISRMMPSFARRYMLGRYNLLADGILNHGMSHLIIQVMCALLARVMDRKTLALFLGDVGTDEDRLNQLNHIIQKRSLRCLGALLRHAAPGLKWLLFPHRFCEISSRPEEIIAKFFQTFQDLFIRGVRANPVLCRSAVGEPHPEWGENLYNEGIFQRIRYNCSRLWLHTADILSGLRRLPDGWATRVYLSNVPDYLSVDQVGCLIRELQRVASSGARMVYYSLYDRDELDMLGPKISKPELKALQESDNVFIYPTIMVRQRA